MNAIITFNPTDMAEAQSRTIGWADAKLKAAHDELDAADSIFTQLAERRMNTAAAKKQMDVAGRRVRFYEKVRAALQLGYYVIPPFDIQLFAVRREKQIERQRSDAGWQREVKAQPLALGTGRYVDPRPARVHVETEVKNAGTSSERKVAIFENAPFEDEIGLPVRAQKPTIIEAVGRALEEKVFDALGIAPAYRAADPIIAGQIARPDGGVLTFLVAWWLDESDL